MKKTTKYFNMATKLLTYIHKDDIATVANIVCAQADKDYETIYKCLKSVKDEIESIEYKLKQEGNL